MPDIDTDEAIDLAAETLRGDLSCALLDVVKNTQKPWQQMSEEEQQDACSSIVRATDNLIWKAMDIIATQGRTTASAKLTKIDNTGKEIKLTLSMSTEADGRHELFDNVGHCVHLSFGDADALQHGSTPTPDNIGSLGLPDPANEYTEADGEGVPDPQVAEPENDEDNAAIQWPEKTMTDDELAKEYHNVVSSKSPEETKNVTFVNWRQSAPEPKEGEEAAEPKPVYVALFDHAECAVTHGGLTLDEINGGENPIHAAFVYEDSLDTVAGLLNEAGFNVTTYDGGAEGTVWPMVPDDEAADAAGTETVEAEATNDGDVVHLVPSEEEAEALDEGREAGGAGFEEIDNPYENGYDESMSWNDGWAAGSDGGGAEDEADQPEAA